MILSAFLKTTAKLLLVNRKCLTIASFNTLQYYFQFGQGDYSASNAKILQMINTSAVDNEAKQTAEVLRAELQKTRSKLKVLEELKGQ